LRTGSICKILRPAETLYGNILRDKRRYILVNFAQDPLFIFAAQGAKTSYPLPDPSNSEQTTGAPGATFSL
jgi:hypothetical protein